MPVLELVLYQPMLCWAGLGCTVPYGWMEQSISAWTEKGRREGKRFERSLIYDTDDTTRGLGMQLCRIYTLLFW